MEGQASSTPRLNPLFEPSSDDEELGQELHHSIDYNKFVGTPVGKVGQILNAKKLLDDDTKALCKDLEKLVMYSATKQTWSRHCSAWSLFDAFCKEYSISNSLPTKVETARAFSTWAISKKGLSSGTVKAYLSSLNVANTIGSCNSQNLNSDPCMKMILKGAKNLEGISCKKPIVRLPMNIDLLDILGHRICSSNWGNFSKQVLWAACVTSFYTSCRMGELLPTHDNGFDPFTTLLWHNIKFRDENEILVFVPFSKTTGFNGKILDIYPVPGSSSCPSAALTKLRNLAIKEGIFDPEKPVFALRSSKNLTKAMLNKKLKELLGDFCDDFHTFTGHSFRAAIPSLISSHPDKSTVSELKDWGSWESNSYRSYLRDVRENRKKLFSKIIDCMYSSQM